MYIRLVYSEVHKTRNTRQWTFIALLFRVCEIFRISDDQNKR